MIRLASSCQQASQLKATDINNSTERALTITASNADLEAGSKLQDAWMPHDTECSLEQRCHHTYVADMQIQTMGSILQTPGAFGVP
jgi:hypothetical protein